MLQIDIPADTVRELCRRRHISELALFGSVLRDDFCPESDVDVLVEFEPGRTPGFKYVSIQEELSVIFGNRKVDLVTRKFLNQRVRDHIPSAGFLPARLWRLLCTTVYPYSNAWRCIAEFFARRDDFPD